MGSFIRDKGFCSRQQKIFSGDKTFDARNGKILNQPVPEERDDQNQLMKNVSSLLIIQSGLFHPVSQLPLTAPQFVLMIIIKANIGHNF